MDSNEVKRAARDLLARGKIDEALQTLLGYAAAQRPELEDELVFLQSNYHYNREQFEIKMTINKAEYDLALARNINAIQEVMRRLDEPGAPPRVPREPAAPVAGSRGRGRLLLIGLLTVVVLAVGYYLIRTGSGAAEGELLTATPDREAFIGEWLARVSKTGYYINRGAKQYFEDADAHWHITIRENNTAVMRGTIDTSGRADLKWFFSPSDTTLTFIQPDETSFAVKILQNERERQTWRTTVEQGNKREEWVWTLTRE